MLKNQKGAAGDFWEKWKAVSTSVGIVLIPIVIAFIANQYSKSLKDAEIQLRYLELAVKILEQKPTEHNSEICEWAVSQTVRRGKDLVRLQSYSLFQD